MGNGPEPFLQQAMFLLKGIDDNFYSDTGFSLVSLGDTATTVLLQKRSTKKSHHNINYTNTCNDKHDIIITINWSLEGNQMLKPLNNSKKS